MTVPDCNLYLVPGLDLPPVDAHVLVDDLAAESGHGVELLLHGGFLLAAPSIVAEAAVAQPTQPRGKVVQGPDPDYMV